MNKLKKISKGMTTKLIYQYLDHYVSTIEEIFHFNLDSNLFMKLIIKETDSIIDNLENLDYTIHHIKKISIEYLLLIEFQYVEKEEYELAGSILYLNKSIQKM